MKRDYGAVTNMDSIQWLNTMLLRGAVVGACGAVIYLAGRSMLNDLMEEVRAGLT